MNGLIKVDTAERTIAFAGSIIPCSIGRGGACPAAAKKEGDGCTPLGAWPVRGALLRPGRVTLATPPRIPWRWTRACDGWSDDARDSAYNRPVLLPYTHSHEPLQRHDEAYDIVIVLGYNDAPPVPGMGSAIFWHIWTHDELGILKPTEGCIAIAATDMRRVLCLLEPEMTIEIY